MSVRAYLEERNDKKCELCSAGGELEVHTVPPATIPANDNTVLVCTTCERQINQIDDLDYEHWKCLRDSMWSAEPAVQVTINRMLKRLDQEAWPMELMDQMYLDEDTQKWADSYSASDHVIHRDSNGVVLEAGDTVVLIKDLNVKGANFTAKRGTSVRRISLVSDNVNHIEGKINDQRIVILTQYVKKSK